MNLAYTARKPRSRNVQLIVYVSERIATIIEQQCANLDETRSNYLWRLILTDLIERGFLKEQDLV